MDAHTRLILQALHTLLLAAIACAPSDGLYRVYTQALRMTERELAICHEGTAMIACAPVGTPQSRR
jgi:hypothetical protein